MYKIEGWGESDKSLYTTALVRKNNNVEKNWGLGPSPRTPAFFFKLPVKTLSVGAFVVTLNQNHQINILFNIIEIFK